VVGGGSQEVSEVEGEEEGRGREERTEREGGEDGEGGREDGEGGRRGPGGREGRTIGCKRWPESKRRKVRVDMEKCCSNRWE
jgi:hypothetical protein